MYNLRKALLFSTNGNDCVIGRPKIIRQIREIMK